MKGDGLDARLDHLRQAVFGTIKACSQKRTTVLRCVTRQVDRQLKRVDVSTATSIEGLQNSLC